MHGGSGRQKSAVSVYVGLSALVLEGRVFGGEDDDESFLGVNALQQQHHAVVVDELENERSTSPPATTASSSSSSAGARHGVINRISEKLMQLRQFPGTSKDVVENSIAIPVNARDECDYERQPRLHHVASAREFQRNPRLASISTSSTLNSSSAASLLHDIDVDWNDISIVLNGLDSLLNVPTFPLKLATNHTFRATSSSMPIKTKMQQQEKLSSSPSSLMKNCATKAQKKQGPHCEKFLKKIGLLKLESAESSEVDHMCNHVNNYVSLMNAKFQHVQIRSGV